MNGDHHSPYQREEDTPTPELEKRSEGSEDDSGSQSRESDPLSQGSNAQNSPKY